MAIGDVLSTFSTPATSPGGLAWDAGLGVLWHVDRTTNTVYQIDPADGSSTSQFTAPGATPTPQGLTYDGTNLWLSDDDAETIYKLNPATGAVVDSFASPGTWPTGLAWDGTNLWSADGDAGTISKLDPATGAVQGTPIASPATGGADSAQGLTWDPNTSTLWHVTRAGALYELDPADGTVLQGPITTPDTDARGLAIDPATGDLWHTDTSADSLYRLEGPAPPVPAGGIAVDASTPARVTAASGTQVTTAAFDPPAAAVLVACVSAVTDTADTYSGAVSDSLSGTWTEVVPDGTQLLIDGQDGYVGMFWRVVDAAAVGLTVTAQVTSDGGLGLTTTTPTLKVYVLTGVDLLTVGAGQSIDVASAFNSVGITPEFPLTPRNLLVVAATEANSLGVPASNDATMVVDGFDTATFAGLSAYLPITDPPPSDFNLNAAGTDPAAWRILATEFAPRLVATVIDGFEDGTISDPPWGNSFNGAVETGGGLELPTVAAYSGAETTTGGHTLVDSFVFAQMSEVPTASAVSQGGAGTGQALLEVHDAGSAASVGIIRIGWQDDQLRGSTVTGTAAVPVFTDHFAITYDPVAHAFMGIRGTGGSVTYETSPDGATWTVRATISVTADLDFPIINLDEKLTSGFFGAETPPVGQARFEGINVAPQIKPASIPSAEAFGTPTLRDEVQISPFSIVSAESFGTPTLKDSSIRPSSIPSAESVAAPTLVQLQIFPNSIPSAASFELPELIAGGLEPWQLNFSGLLLGDGTDYELTKIEGLKDIPDLRTSDQDRAQDHGQYPGSDFLSGRALTAHLEVHGADDAAFAANLEALDRAMRVGGPETELRLRIPGAAGGQTRRMLARARRLAMPVDLEGYYYRQATAAAQWWATDPLIYDSTEQTLITPPEALPGEDGLVTATNIGTFDAPWLFTITGPATNPTVTRTDQPGVFLAFAVVLADGEVLEVDVDQKTVLRDGVNAYSTRTADSSWWELPPGSTPLKFTVTAGLTAQLIVRFRSAWQT